MAIKPTGLPPVGPAIDDEKLKAPMPSTPPAQIKATRLPGNPPTNPLTTGIKPTGLPPRQPNAIDTGEKPTPAPGFQPGPQKPNDPVTPPPPGGIPAGTPALNLNKPVALPGPMRTPNMGNSPRGTPPVPPRRPITPPGLAVRQATPAARSRGIPANMGPGSGGAPNTGARPVQKQRFDNGYGSQVTPGRWGMR